MKKLFSPLWILLAVMLVFVGCSSKTPDISVKKVSEEMVKSTTLVGELVQMSQENVELLYTAYKADLVAEHSVYACASKATAEEIAIFRAVDSSKAEEVKKILEKRIENLKTENKDYNPNEMNKLQQAQIIVKNDYVALIIADDTAAATKTFQDAF